MGLLGDTFTAVSAFNPSALLGTAQRVLGLGSSLTSQIQNPSVFLTPPSLGNLGALGSTNIIDSATKVLQQQAQVEAFVQINKLKNKLPGWIHISNPLSNQAYKLGFFSPTTNNVGGYDNYDKLGSYIPSTPGDGFGGNSAIESIMSRAKAFAKPTRYRVILDAPENMPNWDYSMDTSFSCSAAALPGMSLSTFDSRRGEPNLVKMPYDVIYEDVKMTFQVSENMKEHTFFEQWLNWIYDEPSKTFRYANEYYSDISIIQLDNSLNELKWISLIDAYPISISEIALSYDAHDTIETFDVGFAYRKWETIK